MGKAYSQNEEEILAKKVKLEEKSYTIEKLINELNQNEGIHIVINGNENDLNTLIEFQKNEFTLEKILQQISKSSPYEYSVKNGHIILKKKKLSEKYEIKGNVIDSSTSEKLVSATIYVDKTNKGTFTDENGRYFIKLPPGEYSISCSFMGYKNQTKKINLFEDQEVTFILSETNQKIQEVEIKKERRFFADFEKGRTIETITPESIEKVIGNNVADALHASLKGVWATKTSGAPGDHQRIRIRGLNSIFGNVDPLYVVDGVPVPNINYYSIGIADLNKHDIECITVLKDASSTALYGFQGVNGVILIDTKKGGEKKIEFQTTHGVQWFDKRYSLLDTKNFLNTYKLSDSLLRTTYYQNTVAPFAKYPIYNDSMTNTDMQKILFRYGMTHEYQLSGQGSIKQYNFYLSGNLYQQNGVIVNTQYQRYTLTANLNRTFKKKLATHLMYKASLQENNNNLDNYLGNDYILQIINTEPGYYSTPDSFLQKPNRLYYNYEDIDSPQDPKERLNQFIKKNTITHHSLFGSGEYSFNHNLSFKASIAFSSRKFIFTSNLPERYLESKEIFLVLNQQYHIQYKKQFNRHNLSAIIRWRNYGDNISWKVLLNENVDLSNISDKDDIFLRGSMAIYGEKGDVSRFINSFVGHVNYNYNKKYFVSIAANKEYLKEGFNAKLNDLFSSVALTWDLAKEYGLNKINQLDYFLIYANRGTTGNYPLNSLSNDLYNTTNYRYGDNTIPGSYIANLANPDLSHEKVNEYNIGSELSLFKGRFIFNVDMFKKINEDLIIQRDIPYYYGGGFYFINIAKMKNEGLEYSFNIIPVKTRSFQWQMVFNYSQNNQYVLQLDTDSILYFNNTDVLYPDFIIKENERLGNITGYEYVGYNKPIGTVVTDTTIKVWRNIQYRKHDTLNNTLTVDDKTVIGNSLPKFYLNWQHSFTYKNFELDILLYGVFGADKYNATKASTYMSGTNSEVKYIVADTMSHHRDAIFYESSYFIEDASFLRLKTVSFSYSPTKDIFKGVHAKFTVSVNNLITLTKYSGYDPEASIYTDNTFSDNAIDRGAFPNPKSVFFTLKLSF